MSLRLCFSLLFCLAGNLVADELDIAILASSQLATPELVPRSTWIKAPSISGVTLSPNGRQLAYALHNRHKTTVWLLDTSDLSARRLFATTDIRNLSWSGDGQLLFFQRADGIGAIETRSDTRPMLFVSSDDVQQLHYHGVDSQSPRHVYVSIQAKPSESFKLYRIDHLGNRQELLESTQRVYDFLAPDTGPVKFLRKSVGLTHEFYRMDEENEQLILSCDFADACNMAAYTKDDSTLYLTGRKDADVAGLLALDANEVSVVHQHPQKQFDISNVIFDHKSGRPLIAEYETESYKNFAIDGALQEHLETIETDLGTSMLGIEISDSAKVWLVVKHDARRHQPYFYLYSSATKALTPVLEALSNDDESLDNQTSAIRTSFWYPASDEMQLQGYVTLPRGIPAAKAPLIVMPHGGPWSRASGFYSKTAQFLANRGYAVFEPNFRASVGFGRRYMLSANRDFGRGRVHADIIEGTQYLLSRGIGDEQQIAMVGHSFGGFSTLGALAFEPKMFKLGFAAAAPATLSKAIRHYFDVDDYDAAGFRRLDVMARLAVDVNDAHDLKRSLAQSPDAHASTIEAAVYLWAGAKDDRVNILDVRDYALRLRSMGKEVTLLSAPDSDHGPRGELATEAYFYYQEQILNRHLGGRFERATSPRLDRYLSRHIVLTN